MTGPERTGLIQLHKIHLSILRYISPVLYVLYKICEFLMKFCINDEVFFTILIKTKGLLHYKVFKLDQILHVDKTCFLRPGHIYVCIYIFQQDRLEVPYFQEVLVSPDKPGWPKRRVTNTVVNIRPIPPIWCSPWAPLSQM